MSERVVLWDLELALALAREDLHTAAQFDGRLPFSKKTTSKVLRRRISCLERKISVLQERVYGSSESARKAKAGNAA